MKLEGKNVVLGIAGGIAVYKICTLVRLLKKNGANVDVIMTKNASEFVSPLTFETLSGNAVTTDMFDRQRKWEVEHISLAKKADIFVIAPATANIIGKIGLLSGEVFLRLERLVISGKTGDLTINITSIPNAIKRIAIAKTG